MVVTMALPFSACPPQSVHWDEGTHVVDEVKSVAGERLQHVVEVDGQRADVLYADERVVQSYGGRDVFEEVVEGLCRRLANDVVETELEKGADPLAGDTRTFVTFTEHLVRVRFWVDGHGLVVTVDRGVPVEEIIATVEGATDDR
jgi:hypothetical protein